MRDHPAMTGKTSRTEMTGLARALIRAVHAAGSVQLAVLRGGFKVRAKADASPVTEADTAAENIILEDLHKIAPDIPIIAEEAASRGEMPTICRRFFLVDPLDGTREFIREGTDFTVNIALVEDGAPVFGIILAPARKELWLTAAADLALHAVFDPDAPLPGWEDIPFAPITTAPAPADGLRAVASRSHMTAQTEDFLKELPVKSLLSAGSSLKFCLLAQGLADVYPRFGPTMEWDTAAGDAILRAAGGITLTTGGEPLIYGKAPQGYRNPSFIAWARPPAGGEKG